jgi:hypothetical protein
LPALSGGWTVRRGLRLLFVVAWVVVLIWVLVWLTGHALLLK